MTARGDGFVRIERYSDALRLDRKYRARTEEGQIRLSIAVGGNANLDFAIPALRAGLRQRGIAAEIASTTFDGWVSDALTGRVRADFWIIWHSAMGATRGMCERPGADLEHMAAAIRTLQADGQRVIVVLPETLATEDDPFSPFVHWRQDLLRRLNEDLPDDVVRVSIEHVQRRLGSIGWHAARYWSSAKSPAHPDALSQVGDELSVVVSQLIARRVKAVIVDLDDTIWGGIVGDDGSGYLQLDRDGAGRPYLEMQRYLLDLTDAGIPLCVASKNSPEQAIRAFEERAMPLSLDDFVYFEASWEPKHVAIKSIATRLRIGIDTVCFLDDSPRERAEARHVLPDLIVPELPEDPEVRVPYLQSTGLFMTPVRFKEDGLRVQQYKDERRREFAASEAVGIDEYLEGLEIKMEVVPVADVSVARATSLINKTNQFNITGHRLSERDVMVYADADDQLALGFTVSDRFGDLGMISVMLAASCGESMRVDTWVVSCRAFGRSIEHGIIDLTLRQARSMGLSTVCVDFVSTPRNKPAESFLNDVGTPAPGGQFIIDSTADLAHWVEFKGVSAETVGVQ